MFIVLWRGSARLGPPRLDSTLEGRGEGEEKKKSKKAILERGGRGGEDKKADQSKGYVNPSLIAVSSYMHQVIKDMTVALEKSI